MAENVEITPGTGDVVAADDISGVKYQRIKLIHGANNTNDGDVSSVNPLPVEQAGAATEAKQDTIIGHLDGVEALLSTIAGDTTDIETAVELIDDAIKTDDAAFTPATDKVMMAGFEFDDTTPDSVNEGDAGAARMSANRNIYNQIRDAAGNERGANVDASNRLQTVTTAAGNETTTKEVVGDVAQDAAVAGNPVLNGGRASTAVPTAMSADGDSVYDWKDRSGATIIKSRPTGTATLSNVSSSASSVSLLASNTSRLGAIIFNDSIEVLYVKLGATASTTSFTYKLNAGDTLELISNPIYTGAIDGIWASANGAARITEF